MVLQWHQRHVRTARPIGAADFIRSAAIAKKRGQELGQDRRRQARNPADQQAGRAPSFLSDEAQEVMPEFLRVEPGAEVLHAHLALGIDERCELGMIDRAVHSF